MPIYDVTPTGGLLAFGCAFDKHLKGIATYYGPGDVAYSLPKALKGRLEKIVVKQQIFAKNSRTQLALIVLYKDNDNALWNEDELIDFEVAKAIAEDYWLEVGQFLDKQRPC